MKKSNLLVLWCYTASALISGCATSYDLDTQSNIDQILELNSELSRSMIVDRDKALFEDTAVDSFQVLAPGGVVENKQVAIRGLSAWDVKDIKISGATVAIHDNIATVINRLDIDGTMQPIGRWGPLKSMRVFQYENGEWKLVSQSLTPCLPKVIEIGRC